ncbi:MAG TPA: hypothetical protein P5137_16885 [Candidatus Brocadiia bacterium]|nr:hypothetical protein [Candidatus Brocadiia bacterium]
MSGYFRKQAPGMGGLGMSNHIIVGVHVTDRIKKAGAVQKALTECGCSIKTRLGLHEASETECSQAGVILLEVVGGAKAAKALMDKLAAIQGVEVKKMVFTHP